MFSLTFSVCFLLLYLNQHYQKKEKLFSLLQAGFGSGNNFVLLPRSGPLVSIAGSFYEPFLNSASAATTIGSGLGASGGKLAIFLIYHTAIFSYSVIIWYIS